MVRVFEYANFFGGEMVQWFGSAVVGVNFIPWDKSGAFLRDISLLCKTLGMQIVPVDVPG